MNDEKPTPDDTPGLPDLMLPREAAEYFRVRPLTISNWLRAGIFPNAFKLAGKNWRIPKEDVLAFAQSLRGDRDGERTPVVDRRRREGKRVL